MPPKQGGTKPKASKRASIPRRSDFTKDFEKDWQRLERTGRYNMAKLKEVMLLIIANAAPLPPEWKDHELSGDWAEYRECHVGGDFLLIYTFDEKYNLVVFTRAGTHTELFD
ncbi:type II toxin-antitoxin system YafQ family toxin [Pararhizobium sp.]|uniref:type II toxin-antitoxin system YafQ family toxin n=1 Tax=Pararhizobium sp. TaxID=1977563 RepID=UPI00271A9763|nr:type II toxin-antitoxin system YafQ family toxin [Pararhizobium sp.]MDO9415046.1 type II toxin-antitoxin system YafQ family toxin [Pararhizobium sp.]